MKLTEYQDMVDSITNVPMTSVFYHGTVLSLAKSILKHGLRENPSQRFITAHIHSYLPPAPDESGRVFITRAEQWAKNYAKYRARLAAAPPGERVFFAGDLYFTKKDVPLVGGAPTVLELNLPPSKISKLESDPQDSPLGYSIKSVGPQYITRLHVLVGQSWIREKL